jgi:hypothetical protein
MIRSTLLGRKPDPAGNEFSSGGGQDTAGHSGFDGGGHVGGGGD